MFEMSSASSQNLQVELLLSSIFEKAECVFFKEFA